MQTALRRMGDAKCLRDAAENGPPDQRVRWGGARYLAGIAVECQAKWVLCQRNGVQYVDDVDENLVRGRGHDLAYCLEQAGILETIGRSEVKDYWRLVGEWTVNWRYDPDVSADDARRFITACDEVLTWLRQQATR